VPLRIKIFRALIILLTISFLTACAASKYENLYSKLNGSNYRDRITVIKPDKIYFEIKYVGIHSDCFPVGKILCSDFEDRRPAYVRMSTANLEQINVRLIANQLSETDVAKELAMLTAADVAIARGYKYFIVKETSLSSACSKFYAANTYGSATVLGSNATYTGTTLINENNTCSHSNGLSVLLLNDPALPGKGVGYADHQFIETDDTLRIDRSLYVGLEGASYSDFNRNENFGGVSVETRTPSQAWKVVYDAQGLSRDLRAKYQVNDKTIIEVSEQRIERIKQRSKDLIQKNIVQ
jgi:hypothetical protein